MEGWPRNSMGWVSKEGTGLSPWGSFANGDKVCSSGPSPGLLLPIGSSRGSGAAEGWPCWGWSWSCGCRVGSWVPFDLLIGYIYIF